MASRRTKGWLLLAVVYGGCWVSTAHATDRVVLLIETALYDQTQASLLRYERQVELRFPVDLQVHVDAFASFTPEAIRSYIQSEYDTNGLDGAILVGQIPYALWRQGYGTNEGILSFFYEDLDGSFTDTDGDGLYDWHEWGVHDGPEIWVCWMRPPVMNPAGYLTALLDEANAYYTGAFVTTKRGLVACHEHYDNNFWPSGSTIPSMPALVDIYGLENVDTDGEGADLVIAHELLTTMLDGDYEIIHHWSHAWAGGQAWDSGTITSTNLMTAAAGTGPLVAHIYGCHSGDFIYLEGASYSETCIAVAYAFGPGAGQGSSGTSWSYGTEGMNYITEAMRDGAYLGAGYKHLLDVRENSVAIQERYPDRDPHMELSGNNLFGNPFLYADWAGFPDLEGDLDGDCDVDLEDLANLLSHYGLTDGATYPDGDLDCDSDVDLADLTALLSHYGEACP
jgi:hypothetical protein